MTMIEVNSVDAIPGEAEILAGVVNYIAARLFTLRQRKTLSVMIDVTGQEVRVPVTRAMLGPQRAGLGTKAPTMFEMTVSTAAGIRDAAETITHELLHISQAVNGRLNIVSRRKKINGRKMAVDVVRWMGGKPIIIDNLAWHLRPWEIEACHWQSQLVEEFLNLAAGNVADQPVQSGKRQQLALYPVRSPSIVPAQPEPDFDHASGEKSIGGQDAEDRITSNGESIDRVIAVAMPADPDVPPPAVEVSNQAEVAEEPQQQTDDLAAETGLAVEPDQDLATVSSQDRPEAVGNHVEVASGPAAPALPAALPDTPVYPRPVIEVEVPGLDAPRALERDAMMKKLDELRQRGLTGAGEEPEAK